MKLKLPISLKLMLFIAFLSLILIYTISYKFYSFAQQELVDKFGMTLEHIALTGAIGIDTVELQQIRNKDDFQKPEEAGDRPAEYQTHGSN